MNPKLAITMLQRNLNLNIESNNMARLYKLIDHLFSGFDLIESQYTKEVLKGIDPKIMEKVKEYYDDRKKNGYVQLVSQ